MIVHRFLPYYGGKNSKLAMLMPTIREVADITEATTFVDLYGGGGSCTVNAGICGHKFDTIVYNELDPAVVSLMAVLTDEAATKSLCEALLNTDIDKCLFEATRLRANFLNSDSISIQLAYDWVLTHLCSFNLNDTGYSAVRAKMCHNIVNRLMNMQQYVNGIYVLNKDAMVILDVCGDDPKTLKLLDVPYHPCTRNPRAINVYRKEYTREDHQKLVKKLCDCTNWILCGYDPLAYKCEDYLPLEEAGAKKVLLGDYHLGSSARHGNPIKKAEYLWIKY